MDHVAELLDCAEDLGLECADLDMAVHDCAQDAGLDTLNSVGGNAAQEDHIAAVEADAAAVNNGGLEAQIGFLLEHNSADEVRRLLRRLARAKRGPGGGRVGRP
jgi:hypothetical protein